MIPPLRSEGLNVVSKHVKIMVKGIEVGKNFSAGGSIDGLILLRATAGGDGRVYQGDTGKRCEERIES